MIWFDCNTPKHALLFGTMAKEMEEETLLTCRDYNMTRSVLENMGLDHKVVGSYGGKTLEGKLLVSVDRTKELASYVVDKDIDYCVYLNSPEAARVSFGLDMETICFNDTPHAEAILKLVVPFADRVFIPTFLEREDYVNYTDDKRKIEKYDGMDAAEIVKGEPSREVLKKLGVEDKFIVFRPEEAFASYYEAVKSIPIGISILERMEAFFPGYEIVAFPRYSAQRELLSRKFDDLVMPEESVDSVSLEHYADLVITGGSTMAEEACLQGTPSISYFPKRLARWDWLEMKKFPGWQKIDPLMALQKSKEILKNPDRYEEDTEEALERLESPLDKLLEEVK